MLRGGGISSEGLGRSGVTLPVTPEAEALGGLELGSVGCGCEARGASGGSSVLVARACRVAALVFPGLCVE